MGGQGAAIGHPAAREVSGRRKQAREISGRRKHAHAAAAEPACIQRGVCQRSNPDGQVSSLLD